ncbi:MAG: type VI secretion system tip protein VgrG [Gammaproteobacteria bacterium]|nr:type VI secretion system tip protein VgrG [Gammaproteobacteria bacterium]
MRTKEELGRLFEYKIELLSSDEKIKLEDVLGQSMTVRLDLPNNNKRYFNGIVSRFDQTGRSAGFAVYQVTLRPWLWLLTRTTNCRIFQEMTVPDIIKKVFKDRGFTDLDESLSESYRSWEYCVQYRESDFNFVSRLMEQEGIYYYFKHEDGKHKLVLSDSISAHESTPDYEKIPYYPPSENVLRDREHISDWSISQAVQPGAYVLDDFDFKRPRAELQVKLSNPKEHSAADFEFFDYPGEFVQTTDGERYVKARLEELHAQYERLRGEGDARGLSAGSLFELTDFPREDQNREYLTVSAAYELHSDEFESESTAGPTPVFSCRFEAIDSHTPFRPQATTRKPLIRGPQTAIVVGKSGEEIWTDQYGRVKVQFHWDREGQFDENSSCWIRVSHASAGKSWGSIILPRIGQEVIVDFLEGDPDRPIITGRVYNGDQMPPFGLPGQQVISGMKSNSTKGGGGYNEFVMDDTKGNELIREHGQYDKDSTIEHDLREHVLNNRSRDVTVDETVSIGNNKTVSVGANHTETIGVNQSITVGSNKTETVTINTAETIGVAKELTIGGLYQVTVGAAMNETVGGAKAEEIGAAKAVVVGISSTENIGSNKSVDAGGNITEKAEKDISMTSGKKMSSTAGDDYSVKGSKKGVIDIADQLLIKCGKASILLKKDGTVTIQGEDISIKGSGEIDVKATNNITMKGKKILQN